jgi:phosphoglycolate phosphatase
MGSVIWDWNGTLLNDLDFCVSTINMLLKKRDLPVLNNESYKEVFSFPVKDYYQLIGFDFGKEDFSIPAREFIDLYDSGVKSCVLHNSAVEVLTHFKDLGIRQFVLSAMKQNMLERTLKQQNIFHFFEGVAGLNDHYATSKIQRGEQLISEFKIEKSNSWIIGDTIHDFEVAESLGIRCVLIADGHQSEERLKTTDAKLVASLKNLMAEGIFK